MVQKDLRENWKCPKESSPKKRLFLQQDAKLLSESKNNHPNPSTIKNLMENTFPLRRKEVITTNPRVWQLLRDYPPLGEDKGNGLHVSI